jgi:hypothetical protein
VFTVTPVRLQAAAVEHQVAGRELNERPLLNVRPQRNPKETPINLFLWVTLRYSVLR